MKSYIHKFFKHSHVTISIQDLFFILIILQKISNNYNDNFSENFLLMNLRLFLFILTV